MKVFTSLSSLKSVIALMALLPLGLQARHLGPQEALNAVMQQSAAKAPGLQSGSFSLAYEVPMTNAEEAAVYVFSRQQAGFAVIAADDAMPQLLLGYSDSAMFDPNNLPPSFEWMLSQYAVYVQEMSQGYVNTNAALQLDNGQSRVKAAASNISPICQTKWNQTHPYNAECPMVDNARSVTGCVATAMAQLMKVHNWPVTGTGSNTYTYHDNTLTESFDFGNTTFDWSNMKDSYSGSFTNAQKTAVATLMHGCGVAANMDYSPDGSGASDFIAGEGMIEYLKYDKSLTYYIREWFTSSEWENMIYEQLAAGDPVMICGNDGEVGHAFVCDGCDSSNYYHINWGWGGYCDGYFSLSDLNPNGSGVGGGSGEEGYNQDQTLLLNVVPDKGTQNYTDVLAISDIFKTKQNEYTRSSGTAVVFSPKCADGTQGGFWSYSLGTVSYVLGVKLDIEGSPKYLDMVHYDLAPLTGFTELGVASTDFPVGEYDVTAVYKANGSDWKPIYFNRNEGNGKLHFVVTNNKITITDSTPTVGEITDITLASITQNGEEVDTYYIGQTYDFNWEITTSGEWSGDLLCGIVKDNDIKAHSEIRTIEYSDADTYSESFSVNITSSLEEGQYILYLVQFKDNEYYGLKGYYITLTKSEEGNTGHTESVEFVGSETDGSSVNSVAILPEENPTVKVTLVCDGASWNEEVQLVFANTSDYVIFARTETQTVNLTGEGSKTTLTFTGPWEDLNVNVTYLLAVWGSASGQLSNPYFFQIQETETPPVEDPAAHVTSVTFAGTQASGTSQSDVAELAPDNQKITVTMKCDVGPWEEDICLKFLKKNSSTVVATSAYQNVSLAAANDTQSVDFIGPWDGLESNVIYNMIVMDNLGNALTDRYYVMIQHVDSISGITVDSEDAQYYNMQGIKVDGKLAPGFYIRVQDGKATRILVK